MTESTQIQFENLKGFPVIEKDELIETEAFLHASNEIVKIIETFGKLFKPITMDMSGNIEKLTISYQKGTNEFHYLEDLIVKNINLDKKYASDSLLWLKRGLRLICTFFENIFNDKQNLEILKKHLQDAYDRTLKPYHGWFVQNTVSVISRWAPTRSQLLGNGELQARNLKTLEEFIPRMKAVLDRIDALYMEHNLEENYKV
ncbi:glycolipid transfer protein [Episyrphus balteatus]|uniref:glycolipid transfer protein n=1 Tax=Episyrphus balteatus TaxID=286459 RepID=UPI00248644F3|nr:glycolipid transfer protein [Episyrphus balteatus]